MLASLYNGSVCVWNHETQVMPLAVPYWEEFFTAELYLVLEN